jgi:prepilin-type N-terminal cleavage/methylation domain-containing protein
LLTLTIQRQKMNAPMNRTSQKPSPSVRAKFAAARGMSIVEMLVVLAIVGILSVIAVPMTGGALATFRISGDARSLSNATAVAKMRAASAFSRTRLYVDLGARTFQVETWNTATNCTGGAAPPCWNLESGVTSLSTGVVFGFGPVTTAPDGTAMPPGQAPLCTDNAGATIANTACIVFNSRGVPVDSTFAPTSLDKLYVTDGTVVHGVTVAATGMMRSWSTPPAATPTWQRN